jgi:hypothetical protein
MAEKMKTAFTTKMPLLLGNIYSYEKDGKKMCKDKKYVTDKFMKVIDADGTYLGKAVSIDNSQISICTMKNYFVQMNWQGSLKMNAYTGIFFTGQYGSGAMFDMKRAAFPMFGNNITFFNGKLFKPALTDDNNLVIGDCSITGYHSLSFDGVTVSNLACPATISPAYTSYTFAEVSRSEAGLPAEITLPLKLVLE